MMTERNFYLRKDPALHFYLTQIKLRYPCFIYETPYPHNRMKTRISANLEDMQSIKKTLSAITDYIE